MVNNNVDSVAIMQELAIRKARASFWSYCKLTTPKFYKNSRKYLKTLCDAMQNFAETDEHDVLIVNVPPRHGKSLTGGRFVEWILGKSPTERIMTASYNEKLSTKFSKSVRNAISEQKGSVANVVYSDIFPETKIKQGDAAMGLWSLEGSDSSYLATSPSGTATGFGASYLIVDDLIKDADEAYNINVLEGHYDWFSNTMLSRLESGGKIIIIMTRWSTQDLAGKALRDFENIGYRVKHINMKAYDEEKEKMLCEEVLSFRDYTRKGASMSEEIRLANYQQEPIDSKDRLYTEFKTYVDLPEGKKRWSYVDTADKGKDYLCSLPYVEHDGKAYILDVLYTQAPQEETEPALARQHVKHKINHMKIESNNGGRAVARNVKRIMKDEYNHTMTYVDDFHQSANKESRIYSNSHWVTENVIMPYGWEKMFPDFYRDVTTYSAKGKNLHDDAPDALTGIAETLSVGGGWLF